MYGELIATASVILGITIIVASSWGFFKMLTNKKHVK
jgi:hypothetical protein